MSNRRRLITVASGAAAIGLALMLWPRHEGAEPVSDERTRAKLDLRGDVLFLPETGEPFDGTLVEFFPGGIKRASIEVRDGRAHGITRGWFEDGQLEVEEHFICGVSHGLRTRWHRNGNKKSEAEIANGVLSGRYVSWHENGSKAVEMRLVDGKADGLSRAWYPSGNTKSRAVVKLGKVIEREFSPDGSPSSNRPDPAITVAK